MSFIGGGLEIGGPGDPGRFGSTRGRIGNSFAQGVNYPSPFFDIAHTYFPTSVKQLFRWCRYYFLTNGIVNTVVFKLAEYPVTDIVFDHPNKQVANRWQEFYHDQLGYKEFMIECGLDYFTYGLSLPGIVFPLKKYLKCRTCQFREEAKKIRPYWTFTNYDFRLTCPKCGNTGNADAEDIYFRNANGIRMRRWSPEDIDIRTDENTNATTYFYNIPPILRNDCIIGKKDVVETTSQVLIQAMRQQKSVVLTEDLVFRLKRPSLAGQDRGYGTPLMLGSLKDLFYLQIMKKAQEAVLLERIVPLTVLFPQAGGGTSDPYCVAPDTLVETPDGLMRADAVQEGGYLRSHTGAWRRVEALRARPIADGEKTFRVKVASLPAFPFVVSEGHPILAVPRVSNNRPRAGLVDPEFIEVKHLKPGDYVAYPVKGPKRGHQVLDLADHVKRSVTGGWVYRRLGQEAAEIYEWLEANGDPKHAWGDRRKLLDQMGWSEANYCTAYSTRQEGVVDRVPRYLPVDANLSTLIGWYIAEGSKKGTLVSFSLNINESAFAEDIEHCVTAMGFRGVSHHTRPLQNGRTVDIEDVILSELLVSLCGHGFADKRVPEEIAEAEWHLARPMLAALFAGDGCSFETTTNRVSLKLANPSVVLEARRLFLQQGLIGGVVKETPKEGAISKEASYQLNYNGEAAKAARILLRGGAAQVGVDLAQKSGLIRGDYVLLRIDALEEVTDVPTVIGFQMQGDKSFCVAGVATHNTTINLVDWRDHVATEIARWRRDPNYYPILPLPIGTQVIGGDGKALLLTQEIQITIEQIINQMQCPLEFVKGGLTFSGSNVSMRMMENHFLGYMGRHLLMANWVMRSIANYMGWPAASVRFKPFKMADDIQRKAYLFQLNQAGKVSDTTLLADVDLDQGDENEIMLRETDSRIEATKKQQIAMAEMQAEAQSILMKQQAKSQQDMATAMASPSAPGEPGGPDDAGGAAAPGGQGGAVLPPQLQDPGASPLNAGQKQQGAGGAQPQGGATPPGAGGVDLISIASSMAAQIANMDPPGQNQAITQIRKQSPELADLVLQFVMQLGAVQPQQGQQLGGADGAAASQIDMTPMPEARSPRRAAAII